MSTPAVAPLPASASSSLSPPLPTPSPFAAIAAHLAASRDVELRPLSRFPDSSTLSIAARGDAFIAQAHADPSLFLERYGGDLLSDMLGAFDALAIDSYEVTFHLRRLRAHLMPASVAQIRNRRFRKLIQLQREGIYFADQFMADRDPILFHRYVVAHMPPAERHVWELTRSAESKGKISSAILKVHDRQCAREQFDSMSDEDSDDGDDNVNTNYSADCDGDDDDDDKSPMPMPMPISSASAPRPDLYAHANTRRAMAVNNVASDESEMESDECAEQEVDEDEDVVFDAAQADASTPTASATGTPAGAFSGASVAAMAAAAVATSSSSLTAPASSASASAKTAQSSGRFGFIPEPADAPPLDLPANSAAARPVAAPLSPPPAFGGAATAARFKASLETDAADAARLRRRARLMRRMIQQFLSGADAQWTDYGAIDRDASLDDDAAHDDGRGSGDDDDEDASGGGARAASASSANAWARDSATRDAEDRYFDDM